MNLATATCSVFGNRGFSSGPPSLATIRIGLTRPSGVHITGLKLSMNHKCFQIMTLGERCTAVVLHRSDGYVICMLFMGCVLSSYQLHRCSLDMSFALER